MTLSIATVVTFCVQCQRQRASKTNLHTDLVSHLRTPHITGGMQGTDCHTPAMHFLLHSTLRTRIVLQDRSAP